MQAFVRWLLAAAVTATLPTAARADQIAAAWILLGPGSSAGALANGLYGDRPAGPAATIIARAVSADGACPVATVDGTLAVPLRTRVAAAALTSLPATNPSDNNARPGYPPYFVSPAATAPADLPDGTAAATTAWAVCEAVIPPGHATAAIAGTHLKLPVADPKRILVIGDTGCRVDARNQQDCHDPAAFPFAALADMEAQFHPDLIVHAGDYFYRDTNCLVNGREAFPGCNTPSSPGYETWGDTFDSWNADLFYPGRNLLAAAPWVMARGNHESCGRGARGWFALLDPRPYRDASVRCAGGAGAAGKAPATAAAAYSDDFQPSYIVPAGKVNLLVHDSSYGRDDAIDPNMARNFDYDLTALLAAQDAGAIDIFVTHRPLVGVLKGMTASAGTQTEQFALLGAPTGPASAFANGIPAKIAMLLSGHIHQFEYVNFTDNARYAPQMVVGGGGDNLDPTANPDGATPAYAYANAPFTVHSSAAGTAAAAVDHAYARAEFGFAVLDATPAGYTASVYDLGAGLAGRCTVTLKPRAIACWE